MIFGFKRNWCHDLIKARRTRLRSVFFEAKWKRSVKGKFISNGNAANSSYVMGVRNLASRNFGVPTQIGLAPECVEADFTSPSYSSRAVSYRVGVHY